MAEAGTTTPTQQQVNLLAPPRIEPGRIRDPETAAIIREFQQYLFELYKALVLEGQFLTVNNAFTLPDGFDSGTPVDPNNTTLAEVASVANQALENANIAVQQATVNKARLDAIAALAKLDFTPSGTYQQSEAESVVDKVDAIIDASQEPSS